MSKKHLDLLSIPVKEASYRQLFETQFGRVALRGYSEHASSVTNRRSYEQLNYFPCVSNGCDLCSHI